MNELLSKLSSGDLRYDGRANEVAEEVITDIRLFYLLAEGLMESDDVIRARTTHALEKISRSNPELLREMIPELIQICENDKVPMVKWHIAMILGNIYSITTEPDLIITVLSALLKDDSIFVRSWTIVSLSLIGRKNIQQRDKIKGSIKALQKDKSIAIRTKVKKALDILESEDNPIPVGWL
jgi:HEAT repeat protein